MKLRTFFIALTLFALGVAVGFAAANRATADTFKGKSKQDAATALLEVARVQAGKGTWERLGVARMYYLGGMKAEGQKIIDEVMSRKPESSDIFRVARIYHLAGEWDRAKPLFEQYVKQNPKDDKALAEVGAYYNLHGERARAEELFEKSFKLESEVWSTINAAGSYLGLQPME